MTLIPKITTYSTQIIPTMYQDGWRLITIYDDKMFWEKEEKQTVRKSRTVETWDDFSDFYKLYPNKKGKENARIMWSRLTEKERELAHAWLIRYIAYWKQKEIEKQFLPHPATWLHQKRWEDDISDNVILSKPVQNIKDELDEDKKQQQEKERIDKLVWQLRQDPVKWTEAYDKAKSEIPQNQLDLWPQIAERLIITRIRMRI